MNADIVFSILSRVPDRLARAQSGAAFAPAQIGCRYPERVAHLAGFLNWMSPLHELTREDQRILGLLNAAGRPVHAADEEAFDDELDAELAGDEPLPGAAGPAEQAEELAA